MIILMIILSTDNINILGNNLHNYFTLINNWKNSKNKIKFLIVVIY